MENQLFFMQHWSNCYSRKSPNDLLCKELKIQVSCLAAFNSLWYHSNFQNNCHMSTLGIICPNVMWKSISKKGSWLSCRAGIKIELVSQPFISYRLKYQVLYASFECHIKCILNLESALCIEFRITVTSNLDKEDWTAIVQLMKGSKNKRRQTKNIWWVYYFIQLMNRCVSWWQLRDISEVSEVGIKTIQQFHHLGPFTHPLSSSPSVDHNQTVNSYE